MIFGTPTAVKVKGKTTWLHLNHCSRAPVSDQTAEDIKYNLVQTEEQEEEEGVEASEAPMGRIH